MSALPYMPLYVADYLADTAHLSAMENGAYLMLIMNYWQRGCHLPGKPEQLARIARVTLDEWNAMEPMLIEFFDVQGGRWHHQRIEFELNKVREKSAKASSAGKASAQRKINERPTDVEQTFNHTDTDTDTEEERDMSETSSDKPDLVKAKRTRTEYPQDFLAFYTAYPSDPGMSKAEAFKAWGKLSTDEQAKAFAAIPAFKVWVGKQGKDYRTVHACRYLSQKRFDGFDAVQTSQPTITLYPVRRDSPEWRAWCEHKGVSSHVDTDLRDVDGHIIGRGWMFPSQWPPNHEARAA